ncbi:MAG: hypothetical protein M0P30_12790 [Syntrophorhabdaceae bacterium]|nr:hypothetical protein [Syntrophorhabdaceae bacterium]
MKKSSEIKKRFKKLLRPHIDKLFFPHGVYGQIVYYLEKQGYYGPHTIPAYIVPLRFSADAVAKLNENSEKHNISTSATRKRDIDKLTEGIDLMYNKRWYLERAIFVDMASSGCEPDTLYVDKDFNNGQYKKFFDFLEEKIRAKHFRDPWEDLAAPDMKFWCYMFTNAVQQP